MAAIRENYFKPEQIMYLGIEDGEHTYLIDGKNKVKLDEIVDFEEIFPDDDSYDKGGGI